MFTALRLGLALGSMNLLFYLSLQTIPLGIAVALEFTGRDATAVRAGGVGNRRDSRALEYWLGFAGAGSVAGRRWRSEAPTPAYGAKSG